MVRSIRACGVLIVVGLCTLRGAGARAQTGGAAALYASGTESLDADRFADALRDCEAAARALAAAPAEQRGRAEVCAARAARGIGRVATAIRYAADAVGHIEASGTRVRRYLHDLDVARALIRELASEVGRVVVYVEPEQARESAHAVIAGEAIAPTQLGAPVAVDPGELDVTVEAAGYRSERRRIDVAAGETRELRLSLVAAPPERPDGDESGAVAGDDAAAAAPFRVGIGLDLGVVVFTYSGIAPYGNGSEPQPSLGATLDGTFRVASFARLGIVVIGAWLPDEVGQYVFAAGPLVAFALDRVQLAGAVLLGNGRAESDGVTESMATKATADAAFGILLDARISLGRIGAGGPFIGASPMVLFGDELFVLAHFVVGWAFDFG